MPRTRPQWVVDQWEDKAAQEIHVIDHGDLVEICSSGGETVNLFIDDATRLVAALEKWIAERNTLEHAGLDLIPASSVEAPNGKSGLVG